tara:strand:- start:1086 stop:1277 length:192 start_codon:yes stop_codon:yes gene_type:complete
VFNYSYILAYFSTEVKLLFYLFLLPVFAAFLNAFALGAPVDPALRILSPEPAAIRLRFACMFE